MLTYNMQLALLKLNQLLIKQVNSNIFRLHKVLYNLEAYCACIYSIFRILIIQRFISIKQIFFINSKAVLHLQKSITNWSLCKWGKGNKVDISTPIYNMTLYMHHALIQTLFHEHLLVGCWVFGVLRDS